MSRRSEILSRFNFPFATLSLLSGARLGDGNLLRRNSFGVVFIDNMLLVCRGACLRIGDTRFTQTIFLTVQSIYSKSGGKNGKHGWVPDASNIGQISNLSLQTYEHAGHRIFREVVSTRAHLHVRSFAHVPPHQFLFAFWDAPLILTKQHSIKLTEESFRLWKEIQPYANILPLVMKDFRKRS